MIPTWFFGATLQRCSFTCGVQLSCSAAAGGEGKQALQGQWWVSACEEGGGERERASEAGNKKGEGERDWSRGPPGRPSSASPPTRWIQRTTSRVGSFFLISNASPVCVRVSVCERHWHSERGWHSPGLGDEACVAAAIDLLASVVQSAAGAPWLTCLETNGGECTDFMLWGILIAFWLLLFLNRSSQSPQQLQTVCVRARMHGCVSVGFVPVQMWVLDSLIAVSCINEYGQPFKELLRCMNILKCSNTQKTLEREGKSWVTPWNTKVVPY